MPRFGTAITVSDLDMAALSARASAERTTVEALAATALNEYLRGTREDFRERMNKLVPVATAKATEEELLLLIAQLQAIAERG